MRLAALGASAPALLASTMNIGVLRVLRLTHCRLNLLRLQLCEELQLDFPLMGLLDHVIQGFAP